MDEVEKHRYRTASLQYCNKLIGEINSDREEIGTFFGGELHRVYLEATDMALDKAQKVRTRIKNF